MDRFPTYALLATLTLSAGAAAQSRTYTFDADFDQGNLVNVNHDFPNANQLQLNRVSTPFPFVNIACSKRGTIVRIDVDTGRVLGEYATAPLGRGTNPSRTTVDQAGNAWVSNRAEESLIGGVQRGSITRVGLVVGGTRVNADRTPNPNGQYLAPPFFYNTCVDRDGDGLIKTSRGLGDVLSWSNPGGVDDAGGVGSAEDECILNYTRVIGTQARSLAVDAANDVWSGGYANGWYEKIDGITGLPIPGTQFFAGGGTYGGLIDGAGTLWGASSDNPLNTLLRFDPVSMIGGLRTSQGRHYGVAVDPQTGNVWYSDLRSFRVREFAPNGALLNQYAHGNQYAQGLAIDSSGGVWVAHSYLQSPVTVGHLRTDGTFVGNVSLLPEGAGPTGVAVDSNGKVWVANLLTDNCQRIDPTQGAVGGGGHRVGAVDLTVDLGPGAGPYNYSDMTGFVVTSTTDPQGTWTVVFDSDTEGTRYQRVTWTGSEPTGTSIAVEVRAAETHAGLTSLPFLPTGNGAPLADVVGRFCEVRATLRQSPNLRGTPILYDLTVHGLPAPSEETPGKRRPGSLLVFPEFDNRPGSTTLLTLTNVRDDPVAGRVDVEVVYIDGQTCLEFNRTVRLSANDTVTLLTTAHDPNQNRGWAYAFAKSPTTGRAIPYDYLIGNEIVADGIRDWHYAVNPQVHKGIGNGIETDLDHDGLRDLDGIEYSESPDRLLVPRFLGQGPASSELVLINLTGGALFTATVDLRIFNDGEEPFSQTYAFRCWTKVPLLSISGVFARSFLAGLASDAPNEILGAPTHQAGWFWVDGLEARSTAAQFEDPALVALLVEHAGGASAADLPFEEGRQANGDFLPRSVFGDTSP